MSNIIRLCFYIFAKLIIGKPNHQLRRISENPVIYYANHSSNMDSLIIWLSLTDEERQKTSFVGASDYWDKGWLRPYILKNIFNGQTIQRHGSLIANNPITILENLLKDGKSIVIFPEGTRNLVSEDIQDFKSGLFHLARKMPDVPLIPIYLSNTQKMMPKGTFIPLPIVCQSFFGSEFFFNPTDNKITFLNNAKTKIEELKPCVN